MNLFERQSTMLRLTSRIAAAQTRNEIFSSLAFGLMDQCFGFSATKIEMLDDDGSSRTAAEAGTSSDDARRTSVPIKLTGESGTLTVERLGDSGFDATDHELLAIGVAHVNLAIDRAGTLESERRRAEEQRAVLDTLADLSGHLELSQLLQAVLQRAVTLLGVTGGELAIMDESGEAVTIVASLNLGKDSLGMKMRLGEGAMGLVAQTHEPIIIPDYANWLADPTNIPRTFAQ